MRMVLRAAPWCCMGSASAGSKGISTARAVIAIAIAVVIPLVLIALLAAYFMVSVATVTPVLM